VLKTRRIMEYDREGNPKPGGKLVPNQSRMVVEIEFCSKCHKVKKVCDCAVSKRALLPPA